MRHDANLNEIVDEGWKTVSDVSSWFRISILPSHSPISAIHLPHGDGFLRVALGHRQIYLCNFRYLTSLAGSISLYNLVKRKLSYTSRYFLLAKNFKLFVTFSLAFSSAFCLLLCHRINLAWWTQISINWCIIIFSEFSIPYIISRVGITAV